MLWGSVSTKLWFVAKGSIFGVTRNYTKNVRTKPQVLPLTVYRHGKQSIRWIALLSAWVWNSPNVSIPKIILIHYPFWKWVSRKEVNIWCESVFLIKTKALNDSNRVLKGRHQVINSLICTLHLLREVIKDFLYAVLSSLRVLSHVLSDADTVLLSCQSFSRTPRRPVMMPSTGSSLLIDMSLHFLLRGSEAASHSSIRRSCFDSSSVARYISGSGHERETRRDASR